MNEPIITAKNETIKRYLSLTNYILSIPYSQRPYEWDKNQVERLLNDLFALYTKPENKIHMLNFITLFNSDQTYEVYDGQQRTITLLLIISVIAQILYQNGDSNSANLIYHEYILKEGLGTDKPTYKLKFNVSDDQNNLLINETFNEITSIDFDYKTLSQFDTSDYIKYLIQNYEVIWKKVNELILENKYSNDEIVELMQTILKKAQIVILETNDPGLALEMFESLNNTGKNLDSYYVLKNKCISKLGEEDTKQYWNQIDSNLEGFNKNDFIRMFKNLIEKKSSDKSGLQAFEQKYDFSKNQSVIDLLKELTEASKYYLYIKDTNQFDKSYNNKEITDFAEELNPIRDIFSFKQAYSLITAMFLKNFPLKEITEVLKHVTGTLVLKQLILGVYPTKVGNPLVAIAYEIYNDKITDTSTTIKKIKKSRPKNLEIIGAIKGKTFEPTNSQNLKVKYLLRTLYSRDLQGELSLNNGLREIDLEHILPQKPAKNSHWSENFNHDEQSNYVYKIGNLTLLNDKINRRIRNEDFNSKKKQYSESMIPANLEIAKNDEWTKKEIDKRTEEIAKKITEIW